MSRSVEWVGGRRAPGHQPTKLSHKRSRTRVACCQQAAAVPRDSQRRARRGCIVGHRPAKGAWREHENVRICQVHHRLELILRSVELKPATWWGESSPPRGPLAPRARPAVPVAEDMDGEAHAGQCGEEARQHALVVVVGPPASSGRPMRVSAQVTTPDVHRCMNVVRGRVDIPLEGR